MNQFIVKEKTIAGVRNRTNGMPNQDDVLSYIDENVILACVSDGCTNCDYPVAASQLNGKVALKIAQKSNIWSMPEKKMKQFLTDCYNEAFANSDFPYEQLCATTAFVLINRNTGAFRAFSVGDTAVLTYNAHGQFRSLLEPMNAFRKSATYFTNDKLTVRRFSQLKQGVINEEIAGFVLYSDGAENIAVPPFNDIKRLVSATYISDETYQREEEKMFCNLQESDDDDISVSLIAVVNDSISQNMKDFYQMISPEVLPASVETPTHSPVVESSKHSDFIRFLVTPRSPEEIFASGLIEPKNTVTVLTKLVRKGIVSCADGKFSSKR